MRVAVITPQPSAPVFGGAQRLWRGLADWINAHTSHEAELLDISSPERDLATLVDAYQRCSTLDARNYDLVISSKYPGWMVEHDRHVVYMLHTLRGLYDTYPGEDLPFVVESTDPEVHALLGLLARPPDRAALGEVFGRVEELLEHSDPSDPLLAVPGPLARTLVHYLDRVGLDPANVAEHFALSRTVATRQDYFPDGVRPRVVFPPSDLAGLGPGRDDYLLAPSRLDNPKRHILLVLAMQYVPHDIPLKITGDGPELDRLVAETRNDPRVEFVGHRSDDELAALYNDALAVPFVPLDEDFGLVALEAMASATPVVTCFDSGGPTELIRDGVNGFVVRPDPTAIAEALNVLIEQRARARRMGARGQRRARHVRWDRLGEALLGATPRSRPPSRRRGRPRILVLSTFPVHPPVGGGQLRCHHLYGSLTGRADLEFISLGPLRNGSHRSALAPGIVETVIPKTREHQRQEEAFEVAVRTPVTDIVAARLLPMTPTYREVLREAARGAAAIILAHPFLSPAAAALDPRLPIVYDAHNAETALKGSLLPRTAAGAELLGFVRDVEHTAVQEASLVIACSDADLATLQASFGNCPTALVPNGVDTVETGFVGTGRRARLGDAWHRTFATSDRDAPLPRPTALFIGSWHPPNVEAMEEIVRLARELPGVTFLIGGSVCAGYAEPEPPSNVVLLGVISNATKRRLLSVADVALNPMASGSGTNLKLLEYFAAGIPTVSTPMGVRGAAARDGDHLLVRELGDFAAAIQQLLENPDLAARLAREARALVVSTFDWQVLGQRFMDALWTHVPTLSGS